MTNKKDELADVVEYAVKDLKGEIMAYDNQIMVLQQKKAEAVKKLEDFLKYIKKMSGKKDLALDSMFDRSRQPVHSHMTIGDAVEALILNEGAQTQTELIKKVKAAGIRVSEKAPYVVIGNAIRRDSRKRFKILNDGRVDLRNRKGVYGNAAQRPHKTKTPHMN